MRDTYRDILKQSEQMFLFSGYTSRPEYFKKHLEYIDQWCEVWHIRPVPGDEVVKAEILAIRDWTREYWH